jgi:hypothetical protein
MADAGGNARRCGDDSGDLTIAAIYSEGVADRVATFEPEPRGSEVTTSPEIGGC